MDGKIKDEADMFILFFSMLGNNWQARGWPEFGQNSKL